MLRFHEDLRIIFTGRDLQNVESKLRSKKKLAASIEMALVYSAVAYVYFR